MSANISEATATNATPPPVPKRITSAQTVCNERNEKNKLCNGHLKQLKTAGEASEVHLRGDDVLFKCQICGTLYMGPPLGHVRDPEKQRRFVEAELAALLQAAGGTLPVIKKNERGVYVIVEPEGAAPAHGAPAAKPAAPAAAKPAAPATPAAVPKTSPAPAAKAETVAEKAMRPPAAKPTGDPDRSLNTRSTYAGVKDTGPVPGETKEQKSARLAEVVEALKKLRAEGGAPEPATGSSSAAPSSEAAATASPVAGTETPAAQPDVVAFATQPTPTASHTPTGDPDRSLMTRATYAGVVDTGPVPGETREQKIERLAKLVEAVKQLKTG